LTGSHLTTIDILILVPVIPALPIVMTWPLPWERWIRWDELPAGFVGPYLLYCAFAAWHFHVYLCLCC
jgi:hypothetical protein